MAASGDKDEHDKRSPTEPEPNTVGLSSDKEAKALGAYAAFQREYNRPPPGGCAIEQVREPWAGIGGWADYAETLLRVNDPSMPYALVSLSRQK